MEAYAKINLFLRILGLREDGYHLLYSVMQTISLSDTVELQLLERPAAEGFSVSLVMDGEKVENLESNTAGRAAMEYLLRLGNPDVEARIRLTKRIPMMAGLGGGSADAAAVLLLMNEAFRDALSEEEMVSVSGKIGADVPFFMHGGAALCEGTGERITPIKSLQGLFLLLIKPAAGISTPEAYRSFDLSGKGFSIVPAEDDGIEEFLHPRSKLSAAQRLESIIPLLSNDLEAAAEGMIPEIRTIRNFFFEKGAFVAGMSGSGSTVFGFFKSREERDSVAAAAAGFERQGSFVYSCETIG
jgi:4-diphosphocytidyl-2-C-methyl-D-erythritol kinase